MKNNHPEEIPRKKWSKPGMRVLSFSQTSGGTYPTYPEMEGGAIS